MRPSTADVSGEAPNHHDLHARTEPRWTRRAKLGGHLAKREAKRITRKPDSSVIWKPQNRKLDSPNG